MNTRGRAPDGDLRTLHIRCGSDLKAPLREAGFTGDYCQHDYPYLIGPVREGPDSLEERARFIAESYAGDFPVPLCHENVLVGLENQERELLESAAYERVVIWSEHDCFDQLVLVRLLAHYATHPRPRRLELINVAGHPGIERFLGLGQLPAEALPGVWDSRAEATRAQLALGLDAWHALASPDPRRLAALMRTGTAELPLLAPALRRHLQELPGFDDGLSLTERLALAILADGPASLQQIFVRLTHSDDPLPGQGDLQVRDRVLAMEGARERVFTRSPGVDDEGRARPPWTDVLAITDLGRRVLAGETDFRALAPPPRWVGGVRVAVGEPQWRWDEAHSDTVLFDA